MFLPKNEHVIQFEQKGNKTKQTYQGAFVVKCLLDAAETVEVGILTDRYTQGAKTLNSTQSLLARAFAELDLRIKRDDNGVLLAPSFWKDADNGRKILDTEIVLAIANKALEAEKFYEDAIVAQAAQAEASESEAAGKTKRKLAAESAAR